LTILLFAVIVEVAQGKEGLFMEQQTPSPPSEDEPQEEPQKKTRRRRLWEWTRVGEKGLWDWLQLLIIPAVLAVGGFLFNQAAIERQQTAEEQRAQEVALQEYINGMENLLLDKDLRKSKEGDEVRTLATARTLTVLNRLGSGHDRTLATYYPAIDAIDFRKQIEKNRVFHEQADRRGDVLRFLVNEDLINNKNPIVDLHDANLVGVFSLQADLSNISLRGAELIAADLSGHNLKNADLREARLGGANLSAADRSGADLREAEGVDEELKHAHHLQGATMPDGSKHEHD
jgi:hypothetical protein